MQPDYEIRIDPKRRFLYLKFTGFFDGAARERFIADRNAAVEKLACGRNQHLTLCDGSQATLMSRESVEAFQRAISDPRYASKRLALVISTALATIQAKRSVAVRDHVGVFTDEAAAMAWLFDETA